MGYQESFMKMENSNDFEKLVSYIRSQGKDPFDNTTPVATVKLMKSIANPYGGMFSKGEEFIYVVGERYGQHCSEEFFEYCKDVPQEFIDGLEIFFIEDLPDKLFPTGKIASYIEFVWL